MIDDPMALDGNAAAGALDALLAFDVTTAIVRCGNCDAIGPGELRFYGSPQAMVLRCRTSGQANIRLVKTRRARNLDLSGAARIDIRRAT
jgi:hypothetical protein